jgi:hypothetical protein
MLKSYLTIAIRNIARYKVYSFINIAGLAAYTGKQRTIEALRCE